MTNYINDEENGLLYVLDIKIGISSKVVKKKNSFFLGLSRLALKYFVFLTKTKTISNSFFFVFFYYIIK